MQANKRIYGLKKDKHTGLHPRHIFEVSRAPLPSLVDLRSKCPPVYDQGQLGSCSANALGCAYEYDQMNNKSASKAKAFMPSRLFIYYNERAVEGSIKEDAGAALEDGVNVMHTKGVCSEAIWAYDIRKFAQCPPKAAYSEGYHNKLTSFKAIPQTLVQLKTALVQGYPVVFGIQVYDSFESDQVAQTGMVPSPGQSEQCLGGHALLITGFDDSKQSFIVRNSWGTSWGLSGYCYIPYRYVLDPNMASSFWVLLTVQ